MGRRLRPEVEHVESRELLSAITNLLIQNAHAGRHALPPVATVVTRGGSGSPNFTAPPTNVPTAGPNLLLTPMGTPTRHEQRRESFIAKFSGPYTIGPGRFSTEARQILIRGAGGSNQFLHGDIQIRIIQPNDPNLPFGGAATMFDRNLNSNSSLGVDGTASQQTVDSQGRPNHLNLVLDVNTSAGTYVEALLQGTMTIKYKPNHDHVHGALEQGTAFVSIRAQIYTLDTSFILANSSRNP